MTCLISTTIKLVENRSSKVGSEINFNNWKVAAMLGKRKLLSVALYNNQFNIFSP